MLNTFLALAVLVLQIANPTGAGVVWENEIALTAGESVVITWDYPADQIIEIDSFSIYRQVGATGNITKLVSLAPTVREYTFLMPGGKTLEYRLRVVAVSKSGDISPSSNEVLITRK